MSASNHHLPQVPTQHCQEATVTGANSERLKSVSVNRLGRKMYHTSRFTLQFLLEFQPRGVWFPFKQQLPVILTEPHFYFIFFIIFRIHQRKWSQLGSAALVKPELKKNPKTLSCQSQWIPLPAGPGQFGGERPLDADRAVLKLWLGAMFTFRISICLFVASVVFMCCRFSNQWWFEMQASINTQAFTAMTVNIAVAPVQHYHSSSVYGYL